MILLLTIIIFLLYQHYTVIFKLFLYVYIHVYSSQKEADIKQRSKHFASTSKIDIIQTQSNFNNTEKYRQNLYLHMDII